MKIGEVVLGLATSHCRKLTWTMKFEAGTSKGRLPLISLRLLAVFVGTGTRVTPVPPAWDRSFTSVQILHTHTRTRLLRIVLSDCEAECIRRVSKTPTKQIGTMKMNIDIYIYICMNDWYRRRWQYKTTGIYCYMSPSCDLHAHRGGTISNLRAQECASTHPSGWIPELHWHG